MDAADPDRVSELLHLALQQPSDARLAFVRDSCGSDEALAAEVKSLLVAHSRAGSFAEQPALDRLRETAASHTDAPTPVTRRLAPGDRLGPYEIVTFIGAGGMAEVYRAADTRLNRSVAIKVLPQQPGGDQHDQFQREALAVAALRHPNICVLHDVGSHAGIDYFVMEHLDGETLAARLVKEPLSLPDVLRYATEIADALAETHRAGVVHRDLKPSNIMLTGAGAKLLDFGVAKRQSMPALVDSGVSHVTDFPGRTSAVGTLEYMAPEQLEGNDVDGRTDLFAFGAVLYEMATREKAFTGETPLAVIVRILERDPPRLRTDGTPALERLATIIQRCLAKDPGERWQTAEQLAQALRLLSKEAASPRRSGLPLQVIFALAAVSLAVVVGSVVAWRGLRSGPSEAPDAKAGARTVGLALGNMRQLTLDEQLETDPRISPDGRFVAYSAGTLRHRRIFVRPIAGGRPAELTSTLDESQFQPRWSRDGREILFVTPGGIYVADVAAGAPMSIAAKPIQAQRGSLSSRAASLEAGFEIQGATWSPDGREIAITSGGIVDILSRDGRARRRVLNGHPQILHSCDWSPDGQWLACVAGNWVGALFGNLAPSALVLVPATAGPLVEITDARAMHLSPMWSPDGNRLYYVSNRHGARDVYSIDIAADGRVHSDPVRTTTGLNAHSIALSPDGRQLAYAVWSSHANIWSLPIRSGRAATTDDAQPVTSGNQTIETLRMSLGGRWLLYDSNQHGNADIFRVAPGGGAPERLTTDVADDFAPDLSPDGQWIAYHSWRDTSRDIIVRRVDGSAPERVTTSTSHETYPIWSPDGQALAFYDATVDGGVFRGPFLVRREGSGRWGVPRPLDTANDPCRPPIVCRLSWSPDGRWLAYTHSGEVKVVMPPSGPSRVVYAPSAGSDPRAELVVIGGDSRTLYFKSHDAEGRASFWSVPVSGGRPVLQGRLDDLTRPSARPDFAVGDGKLFFTIEDRRSHIWVSDVR